MVHQRASSLLIDQHVGVDEMIEALSFGQQLLHLAAQFINLSFTHLKSAGHDFLVGHIRGGVYEATSFADLGDDDVFDPAFEVLGFRFAGSEDQLVEAGLGDDDAVSGVATVASILKLTNSYL